RVAERPRCTTADVEETLDLLSDDDGDGESAADAFGVDRLGILRRHRGPRDALSGPPGPAADDGVSSDAKARQGAKALIGFAACSDDMPSREGAVRIAHGQTCHVGCAQSVGAPRNPLENRVKVVALGQVTGDVSQCLRLTATALDVG